MKKTIALWMLLAPAICLAQPPAECKPSSLNVPGAPYPCVFPDHRAMFRLSAPDARRMVLLDGNATVAAGNDLYAAGL
jgi:enterochelin esterase family protein